MTDQPTLRDQFAMAALTGILANPEVSLLDCVILADIKDNKISLIAHAFADQMLAVRDAKPDAL